jgi:D-alanyl-D-alanine dipeptidase
MHRLRILAVVALAACMHASKQEAPPPAAVMPRATSPEPPEPPPRLLGVIGEYDTPAGMRLVLEDSGRLWFADTVRSRAPLTELSNDLFAITPAWSVLLVGRPADRIRFERDARGSATAAYAEDLRLPRRMIEPQPGTNQLQVKPVRPVAELRVEALAAKPPVEQGSFRKTDLVELTSLDPSIKLEIRYATTNNFLGTRFYDEARAFMQRPAAEAVVRANQALKPLGFGLLIHDAYRPWYVTKMFWDATPQDKRWLVANPAQGSRHNRGEAVDLTLYDRATGRAVEMPSTYDESTDRAFADYPGGTAAQRWRRAVLRRAMEREGFTVNPNEWWHFDYKDWRHYAIGNVPFDQISRR